MPQKSIFSAFLIIILIHYSSLAQDLNFIARGNVGIGFNYISQDFKGIKTFYSPGGGLGAEIGLEGAMKNDVFWYGTLGMKVNLNFHYEEVNGVTTKTSYSWNKKFITAGANKFFDLRNQNITEFQAGGGLIFGIPGTLRTTENNIYNGRINYSLALGAQIHTGLTLDIYDKFLLRPEIRYRFIRYNSKSYTRGDIKDLDPELRKARADGLDISLSIIKTIRSGRR